MQVQKLTPTTFLVTGRGVRAEVEVEEKFLVFGEWLLSGSKQPVFKLSGKGSKKFATEIKKAVLNHIRLEEILQTEEVAYKTKITSCFYGQCDEEIRILTKRELLYLANMPGIGVEVIEEIAGERREVIWK
ncbi:hypothetical protein HUR95_15800 [Caldalkalibacillus thermarum TA2.A1]|uniref:Uncharacterized protein n=1 Tax=Caldalkalibacillus thermarum (strain TA2.A1) TaxID=986075 RepID=A0A8X8LA93_CALTT|nr:hypothetical protein [Caldalkalibacillus thermarum]QZT33668.1 hypothetical protein HUR95_15800 [Caldalkalibacillus thermarum TA2.A1]